MKYGRFLINGEVKYGMVDVDRVIELTGPYLNEFTAPTDRIHYLHEVKPLLPVEPRQIIAIGLNYKEHAKEMNLPISEDPLMFMVSPSALIGPDDMIKLAKPGHSIEYEAELAVVIGKEAYKVKEEDALGVVFGYTIGLDISDRDLQNLDGQYTRAKSFVTYKPVGPFVETDVLPHKLSVQLKQNGVLKQNGNTKDMIHSVEKIIAAVTDVMILSPGDIILTGTPKGVGPLSAGDVIETTISDIGKLTNRVE